MIHLDEPRLAQRVYELRRSARCLHPHYTCRQLETFTSLPCDCTCKVCRDVKGPSPANPPGTGAPPSLVTGLTVQP